MYIENIDICVVEWNVEHIFRNNLHICNGKKYIVEGSARFLLVLCIMNIVY